VFGSLSTSQSIALFVTLAFVGCFVSCSLIYYFHLRYRSKLHVEHIDYAYPDEQQVDAVLRMSVSRNLRESSHTIGMRSTEVNANNFLFVNTMRERLSTTSPHMNSRASGAEVVRKARTSSFDLNDNYLEFPEKLQLFKL
jgi:hypothetical protein